MAGLFVPKELRAQVHDGAKWPWPGWGMAVGRLRWLWERHGDCVCLTFDPSVLAPTGHRGQRPHYSACLAGSKSDPQTCRPVQTCQISICVSDPSPAGVNAQVPLRGCTECSSLRRRAGLGMRGEGPGPPLSCSCPARGSWRCR